MCIRDSTEVLHTKLPLTRNKKLLGTKGIATRSKDATRAPGLTTRNKKLLGTKGIATRSKDATKLLASLDQA